MTAMTLDFLAIGLVTLDVTVRPIDRLPEGEGTVLVERIALSPAGTAAGAALVAARLGLKAGVSGAVGDDAQGPVVCGLLDQGGVDTRLLRTLPGLPTSTTVLAINAAGGRPNFHALGAAMAYTLDEDVAATAAASRFVHWGAVGTPGLAAEQAAALLRRVRDAGGTTSCDLIAPRPGVADDLAVILPHVDWFLPSRAEACAITGIDDLERAGDALLAMGAGNVIIKDGGNGAWMTLTDGRRMGIAAHAIEAIDTTSCGDSFCAGFISALSRGWDPVEAARFGAATAALVAQAVGTTGRLVNFAETAEAMSAMPLKESA